jgi:glycosyltransferase involved in cell wall biosynthesis
MKVAHLTTVHSRDDARIFAKECISLHGRYEVCLIVADGLGSDQILGVNIHDLGKPRGRVGRFTTTALKAAAKVRELEIDLVHIHDSELIPTALWLRAKGIRVIYDVHEDLPRDILIKEWIPKTLRRPVSAIATSIEALANRYFDGIIGATPLIADRFTLAKTALVRNFPLIQEFQVSITPKRSVTRARSVAYIGTLSETRGVIEAVQAIGRIDDVTLVLAGKFNTPALERQVKSLAGWQSVDYRGFVTREDVAKILERSQVGLCTLLPTITHLDSYPVKLFEYMAAGLPVIISDFPLWRALVEKHDCALFVDPLSPDEIAKAISWVLTHPEIAEAMGRNGRKAIEMEFNWQTESEKLIAFYNRFYETA